jgi:NTP pyrophosphatase (non-canonical NTP hydrolase)
MDKTITIEELKKLIQEFCEKRDWDQFHNPKDLAIGISTEANELLDLFRFKNEDEMQVIMDTDSKKLRVKEELADVFFFVLRFAQMNKIDLHDALVMKLEKNDKKYPADKVKGDNKKYNEY